MQVLESIAVHQMIGGSPATPQYIGAASPEKLEPMAAARVQEYVDNLNRRREGQGRSQTAWWIDVCPAHITQLLTCGINDFDTATRSALDGLLAAAKGKQAQSGVILFVRSRVGKTASLLCLKMYLESAKLARFQNAVSADRAIHVEDIDNVLPEAGALKKAALIPHPDGDGDLRVVDEQMEDVADYWLEFLGARSRRKEPQIAKLTVATAFDVLRQQNVAEPVIGKAIAGSLQATIDGGRSETPKKLVERIAKKAGVPAKTLWEETAKRAPTIAEPDSSVGQEAAELLKTTITLGPGITVSGLSVALDARYDWHVAPPGQEGWVLQITSDTEPKVSHTRVSGSR